MEPHVNAANTWMKLVGEYGLSIVFLGCTVGILLYTAVVVIGLLKKWVPLWFESSIASHDRIAKASEQNAYSNARLSAAVDKQCDLLECIHGHTHATKNGAKHAIRAALRIKDMPSDVFKTFQDAERALDSHVGNHHERRNESSK